MKFADYVLSSYTNPDFVHTLMSPEQVESARVIIQRERSRLQTQLGGIIGFTDERKAIIEQLRGIDYAQKMLKVQRRTREDEIMDAIRKHKAQIMAANVPSEADQELWRVLAR